MVNLGIIGKPSNWLISSNVDYKEVKEKFSINLINIDIELLTILSNKFSNFELNEYFQSLKYDKEELKKAFHIYLALKEIIEKYNLEGITVRCFDLLTTLKSTSCLAFAILNKEGIIATCEGDIPSLISMYLIKKYCNEVSFQANPSQINLENKEIIFAHCTLPLSMCTSFSLLTHFESNIGVSIKGKLKEDNITIFKLSANLKDYKIIEGKIIENLNYNNLCRTQIKIKVNNIDDLKYFLTKPLGNHHIIFYGHKQKYLSEIMSEILKKIKNCKF